MSVHITQYRLGVLPLDAIHLVPCSNVSKNTGKFPCIHSTLILSQSLSPITWHWNHICGHQDQIKSTSELTKLEALNILMDANAKQW